MISAEDKMKIKDFREAYRQAMNPNKNPEIDTIIDDIFLNVEATYEEYKGDIKSIDAKKERYKYHILKPKNGRYDLLDFLINRAISNIDGFEFGENAYDHRKVIKIDPKRYEKNRRTNDVNFISKNYRKSRLHEINHAMQSYDTISDGKIHSRDMVIGTPHFCGLKSKLKIMERSLGNKYSNLLRSKDIEKVENAIHSSVNLSYPFRDGRIDEIVTEYYATKNAGMYGDKNSFKSARVVDKPEFVDVGAPNYFNGYASCTKFMFHLENFVSKRAMFESRFFESDMALTEFCLMYGTEIENVLKRNVRFFPVANARSTEERFKTIFRTACDYECKEGTDKRQYECVQAHELLDLIFIEAYQKEFKAKNITPERLLEISEYGSLFSPIVYDSKGKKWVNSSTKEWYIATIKSLRKALGIKENIRDDR